MNTDVTQDSLAQQATTASGARAPEEPSPEGGRLRVRVQSIRKVATDILTIELRAQHDEKLPPFSAGAHIDLRLPSGLVRSYSLANPPGEIDKYLLAVHRSPDGRGGSAWIHDHLQQGATLEISCPRNHFPLNEAAQEFVLVAGGIGITPILAMAYRLRELGKTMHVLYCARTRAHAAFVEELEDLGCGFSFHADDKNGGPPDMVSWLLSPAFSLEAHYYACGPAPMLDSFLNSCSQLGIKHTNIERFKALERKEAAGHEHSYTVELRRSGKVLQVAAKQTLLDALLEAHADVGFSCQEGVCGACETEVLEGEPDHKDSVYSLEEHGRRKTMMVCVSSCKSEKLVLNL